MEDERSPYPLRLKVFACVCVIELSEHIKKDSLIYVRVDAIIMIPAIPILISYSAIQNKARPYS